MARSTRRRTKSARRHTLRASTQHIRKNTDNSSWISRRALMEGLITGVIGNAAYEILKSASATDIGLIRPDRDVIEAALNKEYSVSLRVSETVIRRFVVLLEHTKDGFLIKASRDLRVGHVTVLDAVDYDEFVQLGMVLISEHNLRFSFDLTGIQWPEDDDLSTGMASI